MRSCRDHCRPVNDFRCAATARSAGWQGPLACVQRGRRTGIALPRRRMSSLLTLMGAEAREGRTPPQHHCPVSRESETA